MKVPFTYYLHDDSSGSERAEHILSQLPAGLQESHDEESFGEFIGRPFYEVTLECELDTATGEVTILSAKN